MWPSPETRSPIWKPWTSWPISTTSPTYSWPTCMGTGIVRAAQSSHFQMWMSVPQMAVFRMRISKSLCPMTGLGTSTSSNPAAGCTLAKALMKISERGPSGNDAQVAPDAGKGLDGPFDVLGRMGRAHLGADAGPALGHYRIGKADHIDALVQQGIGHASGQGGIAQHHRDDRVLAGHQVETQGLHPAPEMRAVAMHAGAQFSTFGILEQFEHPPGRRHDGRGQRIGKQVGARTLAQQVDDRG